MEERAALLEALRLQMDFGADEALEERPLGLNTRKPPPAPVVAPALSPGRPVPAGAAEAAALAAAAATLDALRAAIQAFDGSALRETGTQMVFADGVEGAPVMLVGDAPGADEDRQGRPFVGPPGQLLDRMLASIGLSRAENAYMTNLLPWRPPGDRNPTEQELTLFLPFLRRHVALARPAVLVLLGGTVAKALLGGRDGIARLRGKWTQVDLGEGQVIRTLPTLHPRFLLQAPQAKKDAWHDWLMLRRGLNQG